MKKFAIVFLLVTASAILLAQSSDKQSVFELFQTEDYLSITLESDFQNLKKNKNTDDYQPAVLSYQNKDGGTVRWEIEIKPRGKMRRMVCTMPPLKLKFPKAAIKEQGLDKFRTLEMVEICDQGNDHEQYVLREYVAYKLYNMLTDQSFRVQLVKIDFKNTSSKGTPMDGFAFIIENNDEMAKRLRGKIIEPQSIGRRLPNTQEKELFCMFQFMIGNTDWWTSTGHNLDIFGEETDTVKPIPIPYDFDYSGFVNTTYSVPNDKVPIKYVTERFYQGPCRTEAETKETIQVFLNKKGEMIKYCQDFPHFSKYSKKHVIKFLNTFYKIIESPAGIKNQLFKNCDFYEK